MEISQSEGLGMAKRKGSMRSIRSIISMPHSAVLAELLQADGNGVGRNPTANAAWRLHVVLKVRQGL